MSIKILLIAGKTKGKLTLILVYKIVGPYSIYSQNIYFVVLRTLVKQKNNSVRFFSNKVYF